LSEFKILSRHTATVLAGQLATMAYGVTDTIVAGRYSDASLAALSVGSAIFISVYVALMGVLQSLLPVWAELRGAGQTAQVGRSVRQALYLCLLAIGAGVALLLSPGVLLRWADVPADLQPEVERYLAVLALALAPAMLFRMYSTLNQSLGHPQFVTWLQLGSLLVKVPLSIWFALGGWGLQAQGAVGCAWATLVVNYGLLAVALVMLRHQPMYRPYAIWRRLEAPDWPQIARFARLGVPTGLGIMVEVTSFTLMSLFIARLGVVPTSSHQIAANLAAVLYMMPLSIGIAASSRVSFWLGAGDTGQAVKALRLGYQMVLVSASLLGLTLLALSRELAGLYSQNPAVVAMSIPLLACVAVYHFFDAIQAVSLFYLRCFGVVVAPLLVYSVLLWGVGLAGGYWLAYHGLGGWPASSSALSFWAASAAALSLTAALLVLLLRWVIRQKYRT
jgi:multidrug resistance protein, MATE family